MNIARFKSVLETRVLAVPVPNWLSMGYRKRPKFRFGKNFAELFVIQFHAHLQYTGIKRTDYAILCNKSFSVTAKFHNTYLDNSILRCKTFGLLRGRILYSCFDFILILLAKLYVSLKHDTLCF